MRSAASKEMRVGGKSAVVYAALVALVTVAVVSAAGVAMEATGTDDRDILGGTMNADLIEAEVTLPSPP